MSGRRSILHDRRYQELVRRYRYNWVRGALDICGLEPTWQQGDILHHISKPGERVSVSSGHGSGKSSLSGAIIILFMLLFPKARVLLTANKVQQVKIGVFKYLRDHWEVATKRHPWLNDYFVLTDESFYAIGYKGRWEVQIKGYRLGQEEGLAGEHAKHLLYIIDEASGLSDKAFGVIRGALTQADNRMLMLSQPTRPSGHFFDSHHKMARRPDAPPGDRTGYIPIVLNSEESPLVEPQFIKDKLREYGGRDSTEYKIKVLGQFPTSVSGYLLSLLQCQKATKAIPRLEDTWGWVACCDVGNGRDSSVLSLFKVSGYRETRRVVPVMVKEYENSIDPVSFGDIIHGELDPELYPNVTIAVDGDGVGSDTATILERHGRQVTRIRWGFPMHSTKDRERFFNMRAFAHIQAKYAIQQGRMRLDGHPKTAEQFSRLPAELTETGAWKMMAKKQMLEKLGIRSPDRSDTYCFAMLVNYVPANEVLTLEQQQERAAVEAALEEI